MGKRMMAAANGWAATVVAALACGIMAHSATAQTAGRIETIEVHGRALVDNLSGESPDRTVSIYLPPGYDDDRSRRYPVVYLLHGYSVNDKYWTAGTPEQGARISIDLPAAANRVMASGQVQPLIIVMPDAKTQWDGSLYSSSVTIGDWESFIADDLVRHVDNNYRSLADRNARGLAGHSMGGYGTLRIGMRRPDVFSSLYSMSACCLMNDPPPRTATTGNVDNARAAAWSPNPANPPSYFDLPNGADADTAVVAAKWIANSPIAMLDQHVFDLRQYGAIALDVGDRDPLAAANRQLAAIMAAYDFANFSFEVYAGDHVDRVLERVEHALLPFFSEHLSADETRPIRRR